ncbi:MAG: carbohydrate-binding family 9-like protein [Saprospiraceae bacterium]|nr:carbohydrate-binding family 9-like protein [Saprospiraceae bacterium]
MTAFFYYFLLPLLVFQGNDNLKRYEIKRAKQEVNITGKGSDPIWDQAAILTDFQLPWNDEIPQPTSFRALWTDSSLYLLYQVIDLDVVAPGPPKDKRGVLPSDRVEIFFKAHGEMNPYYCLELDPRARVLDYEATYYRNTNFEWMWPAGQLEVLATSTPDGYIVEARISLQSLIDLGILNDDRSIDAGLFRGDFFSINKNTTDVKWISWVHPDSEKPDFHIPSAFGKLKFVE